MVDLILSPFISQGTISEMTTLTLLFDGSVGEMRIVDGFKNLCEQDPVSLSDDVGRHDSLCERDPVSDDVGRHVSLCE